MNLNNKLYFDNNDKEMIFCPQLGIDHPLYTSREPAELHLGMIYKMKNQNSYSI